VVQFDGVEDRDQAQSRVGCDIAVSRNDLPEAETDTYYWADLEGLRVVNRDGTDLGTITHLMATGANDVMVTAGERERLIPFIVDEVILNVDFAKGVVTVDWEWD